jgi:hypothetical protein
VSLLMDYWDRATSFLKENLTVAFPAFHLRNLGSGQGINLMSGDVATASDYMAYLDKLREAHVALRNPAAHAPLVRELQAFYVYKYGFNPADKFAAGEAPLLDPPKLYFQAGPMGGRDLPDADPLLAAR